MVCCPSLAPAGPRLDGHDNGRTLNRFEAPGFPIFDADSFAGAVPGHPTA